MRKLKKINGYLVVRFNARERRDYPQLGAYGVIDAEQYTGSIDYDLDVLEYLDSDSLEVAVEQARGLDAEEDYSADTGTCMVIRETDQATEMCEVDPQLLIAGWAEFLAGTVRAAHNPELCAAVSRHELHGYKRALFDLGMLEDEAECAVAPDTFLPDVVPKPKDAFAHLPPEWGRWLAQRAYALGLALEGECPQNDCQLYYNTFRMCREIDDQLDYLDGYPRQMMEMELRKLSLELETMYTINYAVKQYRREKGL